MKNKILDFLHERSKRIMRADWNYLMLGVIIFMVWVSLDVDANWPIYNNQICTTDKCKARIERLNYCDWNIKCAVKMTQEAWYEYLLIELTNLRQKSTEEVKSTKFNINKLAYAVAMQETKDCTLWYAKTHNNCFWIKHWNTVPCPWVPKMAMCKFKTKEESYEAFKIIWIKWYWGLPNYEKAKRWSWDDRAGIWLNSVTWFYNN